MQGTDASIDWALSDFCIVDVWFILVYFEWKPKPKRNKKYCTLQKTCLLFTSVYQQIFLVHKIFVNIFFPFIKLHKFILYSAHFQSQKLLSEIDIVFVLIKSYTFLHLLVITAVF